MAVAKFGLHQILEFELSLDVFVPEDVFDIFVTVN